MQNRAYPINANPSVLSMVVVLAVEEIVSGKVSPTSIETPAVSIKTGGVRFQKASPLNTATTNIANIAGIILYRRKLLVIFIAPRIIIRNAGKILA